MAFITPIPLSPTTGQATPIPLTVNLTANGATATVVGATFDPTEPLANIGTQLSQIQYYLGGGGMVAAKEPGSMTNYMANIAASLASIDDTLSIVMTGSSKTVAAGNEVSNSIQKSLSTIAGLLSTMIAYQQMALSDQIKHNEFTEQVTNVAREEAKKDPIVVQPDNFTEKVKSTTTNISTLASTAAASGTIVSVATNTAAFGLTFAKDWVASTDIGSNLIAKYKNIEASVASTQADIVAKAKQKQAEALKRKTETGTT